MQVYKGMDIGTAKPSLQQRAAVKHHLIDIVEPTQEFSVGEYLRRAKRIIDDLSRNGKIPLIVGGTGLYIKALTRGIFEGPKANRNLRRSLEVEEKVYGKGYLHERLREIDPLSASRIHPSDLRRIIRALEVYEIERRPISVLQEKRTIRSPYSPIKIGLMRDRDELYKMIEKRVDRMLSQGLLQEVRLLVKKGCSEDMTSMQGLGYRHFLRYLKGEYSLDDAIRILKRDTKRYAKRQFTWFRKEEGITWLDITGITDSQKTLEAIKKKVEKLKELL